MAKDAFSIKEALSFGWGIARDHMLFFLGLSIIATFVSLAPQVLIFALGLGQSPGMAVAAIALVFVLLSALLQLGFIRIALRFCQGQKSGFADLFKSYPVVPTFFVASLLYILIVLAGSILLVVPGIILAIRLSCYGFSIVDRGTGVLASLKESFRITGGAGMQLFWLILAIMGINVIGTIPLGLGLLWTVPLSLVAYAFAYRKLAGESRESAAVPAGKPARAQAAAAKPKAPGEWDKKLASPGADLRSRGLAFLARGDFEGAAEAFTGAVELDPRYGPAYHNRGFAHFQAGDWQQAKGDFDRAIALDADYAKESGSYLYRGLALEKLGERRQAMEDLKMAVSLGNRGASQHLSRVSDTQAA
jgi:tetratricopeptide (TPR) repeat protein